MKLSQIKFTIFALKASNIDLVISVLYSRGNKNSEKRKGGRAAGFYG